MKKFLNSFGKFFSFKYKEQYSIGMEVVKNRSDLYRFFCVWFWCQYWM